MKSKFKTLLIAVSVLSYLLHAVSLGLNHVLNNWSTFHQIKCIHSQHTFPKANSFTSDWCRKIINNPYLIKISALCLHLLSSPNPSLWQWVRLLKVWVLITKTVAVPWYTQSPCWWMVMTTIMKLSGVSHIFTPVCIIAWTMVLVHMFSSFSVQISICLFKRMFVAKKNFDWFHWCSLYSRFHVVEVLISDRECLEKLRIFWLKWMLLTPAFFRWTHTEYQLKMKRTQRNQISVDKENLVPRQLWLECLSFRSISYGNISHPFFWLCSVEYNCTEDANKLLCTR